MRLARKLALFAGINLTIGVLAGSAPVSLVGGRAFDAQALIFDTIDRLDAATPISIVIGDSRSECCLAAGALGFLNLSLEGATPVEGYYFVKRILDNGVPIERLIVSYGPFHVFTQDIYHARTKQFGLFDAAYIDEVDAAAVALEDREYTEHTWQALQRVDRSLPWLSEQNKFALIRAVSLNDTVTSILGHLRAGVAGTNELDMTKFREIVAPDLTNTESETPESAKPNARSPVNELYLMRIAELARQHGIAHTFLVMPFNADAEQPPVEYFERFDRSILAAGFEGCYSPRRAWPNGLFGDSSHLNRTGAERLHAELARGLPYC